MDQEERPSLMLLKAHILVRLLPLVAVALLAACTRETKLRNQLTGTWQKDKFELTLSPDGSFVSQWTTPPRIVTYRGTWKVERSSAIMTITNSTAQGTTNFQAVGTVDSWVVVRADQTDLIWSNGKHTNDGEIISLKRKR